MENIEKQQNKIENKFLPSLSLEQIDSQKEASILKGFVYETRFGPLFNKRYPDLKKQLDEATGEENKIDICRKVLEEQREHNKDNIEKFEKEFIIEWKKIENDFFTALSDLFETSWPIDKQITGSVTMMPIFPRFLNTYSFYIGYGSLPRNIETAAHEIVHFLWFKKWKEIFPEISRNQYESPNLAWRLSEIIDPIILQCDPKIKELINPKGWGYSSFDEIHIDGVKMTDYFKKIYLDSVASGDSFDDTMKKLWAEAQKHEKEISVF
ncbi:MAG TPA: hypothetical protein P5056_01640 [Candidatus Paceibacterota bacterium]|nr:hypothetical protein [Candidatus Paceibacterota bacterium]